MEKNQLEMEKEKVFDQLEEWHTSKTFLIGEKEFKLSQLNHEFRVRVYALYSQIETPMIVGNFGFLEDPKFKSLFKEVENKVMFEDMLISKTPDFWENNEDIYLDFIQTSLKLICYPFFRNKKKVTI
ncbi:hypothetical protein [Aliarcobacter lanthieri]|uniref:hypothetical protein n=1 Tax=Aliarcobacter lanthieri TaxID=1355374 RepID=UPI00047DDF3A|nr:hypothetical protein [Aliarcobacter lanthieri]MBL3520306.1 hypothetical protein [Aliarcobacter lanthieri]